MCVCVRACVRACVCVCVCAPSFVIYLYVSISLHLPHGAMGWHIKVIVSVLAVLHAENAYAHSKKLDISK